VKQHMPDTHGEVDLGPLVLTTMDRYPRLSGIPEAGLITNIGPNGSRRFTVPYTPKEAQEVITRGRKEPRRLSLAEERARDHNKAIARGDYAAAETAYTDNSRDADPGRLEKRYPLGTRNYGHGPRRTAW
jgi:hypothetical protein